MPGRVNIGKNTHQWSRPQPKDTLATHKLAGRIKIGEKSRYELANPDIARKAAKAATTRAINRGWTVPGKGPSLTPAEQEQLSDGVLAMAERIAPTDNLMLYKIKNMEPDKLAELYRNNKFVFEVFFNYGGISPSNEIKDAVSVDASKTSDAYFLIEEYERAFGAIL